jgi:hypothetical protein
MLALTALPCAASEVAILRNGFSIQHERREVVGDVTRLYVNADGSSFVDVPTAEIEHYEAAPSLPALQSPFAQKNDSTPKPLSVPISAKNRSTPLDLNQLVNDASGRYRLDPDLVNSVIKAESGFNIRAVSPKGAQGLMQLMPGTATQLGVPNAFDPEANVDGGTKYLRELLERYNFDLVKALAAYNAGPQRVEKYRGVPPYYETRAYVARIVKDFNKKKDAQEKAAAKASAAKHPKSAANASKHTTALQAKSTSTQTASSKTSAPSEPTN